MDGCFMIEPFGLYVILTDPVSGYETCAAAAVEENIQFLQLRMKNKPPAEILETAIKIERITRDTSTNFIVNDDIKIAMESNADGVHLGQDDLDIEQARGIWNDPDKIYGLSTHNRHQAAEAIPVKPNYIGVGPVFPTPTKAFPDPVVGLQNMRDIITANPLPAVVIGGINSGNLQDVLDHGAVNFSTVRPIMQASEPLLEIRRLMEIWRKHIDKMA